MNAKAIILVSSLLFLISIVNAKEVCENKGLLVPQMYYFKCEQLSGYIEKGYSGTGEAGITIKCGDTEVTEECEVYYYISGGIPWASLEQICLAEVYPDGSTSGLDCEIPVFGQWEPYLMLNPGQAVKLVYRGLNVLLQTVYGSFQAKERFLPYGIRSYPDAGTIATTTCDISKVYGIDTGALCASYNKDCESVASTDLGINEAVSYVKAWVLGPEALNLVTYNNEKVYCKPGGYLYDIETIELQSGCYDYPGDYSGIKKDCCPGEQLINAYCNDDFIWQNIYQYECVTPEDCNEGYSCINNRCVTNNMPCISSLECYGGGINSCQVMGDNFVTLQYSCINGFCQEGTSTSVTCCPPDYGCYDGEVCDVTTYTCKPQIGPDILCGDGVCSAPYEDIFNCNTDCKLIIDPIDQTIIISIIIGVLAVLLIGKFSGMGKEGYIIGALAGALIGYFVYWILSNWVMILLIGVLGSGGVGILVYLIGLPTILGTIYVLFKFYMKIKEELKRGKK